MTIGVYGAAADALGVRIDEIRHIIKTAMADHDVEVECTTLRAGTVIGQILSWAAYHDDEPVLVVEEFWTCTPDIPEWDLALDGHAVRVRVDGVPNMSLELRVDTEGVEEFGGLSGGYVAVGISAIVAFRTC